DDGRHHRQRALHLRAIALGRDAAHRYRRRTPLVRRDGRTIHDVPRTHRPRIQIRRQRFGLPTYLYAWAVGPWDIVDGPAKYVGRGLVCAKVTVFQPAPAGLLPVSAALATALSAAGIVSDRFNGTLKPGSSKHGNASR